MNILGVGVGTYCANIAIYVLLVENPVVVLKYVNINYDYMSSRLYTYVLSLEEIP